MLAKIAVLAAQAGGVGRTPDMGPAGGKDAPAQAPTRLWTHEEPITAKVSEMDLQNKPGYAIQQIFEESELVYYLGEVPPKKLVGKSCMDSAGSLPNAEFPGSLGNILHILNLGEWEGNSGSKGWS